MHVIGGFFRFLNDLLFKMTWLENGLHVILNEWMGLDKTHVIYNGLHFFIYDVIKILLLLSGLIYLSGFIQTYLTPEKTRDMISKFKGIWGNIFGAFIGIFTPFCSCSSIPIFIGFTKAGLPVGVTFSFLITSPMVNLASVVILASIFGWNIALFYILAGMAVGIIGGSLIDLLGMGKYVQSFLLKKSETHQENLSIYPPQTFKDRHLEATASVKEIVKKVYVFVLLGVGIGALIHGVIPRALIEGVLGTNNPFSVWIATLIGIPIYADVFGAIPIAEALLFKGVGLGTVLAFMMAVTALSFPSIILLKNVVKPKLLATFIFILFVGIIMTGYLFNLPIFQNL